ncbi:SGNH/GDSL hydrolase family protein [Albibacterium profundi]|uniref:SGNH/GDSL hydrolase family protein n=1 Tax=Albibacterium profundi TaxID=3134906 RepID=A0ABV5CBF1_9SPHI
MKNILLVLMLMFQAPLMAQTTMDLYKDIPNEKVNQVHEKSVTGDDGITRMSEVSIPKIVAFFPAEQKKNGKSVIIFPGGGYSILAVSHEGYEVAERLNEEGITAFVVQYRLPSDLTMKDKSIGPLQDAQRAIQLVRERAGEWGLAENQIGIMGFSAGGHLASTLGTHYKEPLIPNPNNTSLRPDFMVLAYPVISFDSQITHMGSRQNLIGESPSSAQVLNYSNEKQVDSNTPATFIFHAKDDKVVPISNSLRFIDALKANQVPVEFVSYEKGGHGFGMNNPTSQKKWMDLFLAWLDGQSFITWKNPLDESYTVINGQLPNIAGYDRLPAGMEADVRKPVWNLSKDNAGEYIEFRTPAKEIVVRYQVTKRLDMNHMPATGVSGVDLYAKNNNGEWEWAPGRYQFQDTITYTFPTADHNENRSFRLYLPLYNEVSWLEVGVKETDGVSFIPVDEQAPIIVYGTSIAQGACATRPGLAWTSILGRKLDMPIINLGFSGNGRLEKPLIDVIGDTEARLFVLDCLPNLSSDSYSEDDIRQRVTAAVASLQEKNPATPILLVENSGGGTDLIIDQPRNNRYKRTTAFLEKVFSELKASGTENIYLLKTEDINMGINSTVDGSHPNDIGMMEHAIAYERIIKDIFSKQ